MLLSTVCLAACAVGLDEKSVVQVEGYPVTVGVYEHQGEKVWNAFSTQPRFVPPVSQRSAVYRRAIAQMAGCAVDTQSITWSDGIMIAAVECE